MEKKKKKKHHHLCFVKESQDEKTVTWNITDSPSLSCDFKDNDVTAIKNRDNDQKHQEQKADEKHNSLNGHSCREAQTQEIFIHEFKHISKLNYLVGFLKQLIKNALTEELILLFHSSHLTSSKG